ncbi:glycosyl hydrolase-related protein [Streptacidiphilus sp. ASG 303]|uniref:alpha-mannosidase n=1 Tax=Streptacidiphilus sp. ASG 303 TaxID=2896847 RepID=UPI001E65D594|nr:glycoside hydrolase family 38 C-terminal domain-containing protein [Streptacidiphilus sp. ASG 303]MCD0481497.1 glycosyl hydrolase-related protein [Streptacidiphilus sp. ASG 303]
MHDDRLLVEGRLDRAMDQWIRPAQYGARSPLRVSARHLPGEPVPVREVLGAGFEPFPVGGAWGPPWSTTWFRFEGEVPREWAGRRVEAVFDLGYGEGWPGFQAEALVYDASGVPLKGLHPRNRWIPVGNPVAGGERVELLAEAAANPAVLHGFRPTQLGDLLTAGDEPLYRLAQAELAVLEEEVWHLVLDVEVLAELMHELAFTDPRRHGILRALERMLDALDLHDVPGTAAAGRAELAEELARPAHASAHRLSAVGHAHIDSAWLWPLRETVRKASRTFANVTALAEDYPELVFACSQAQQYAWVKEHQPHVWERIRRAVAAGTWAPVGSMWVESDTNMPGGEALARQLVHGKRFFAEELGVETREVWLPDSFGYTAAFPQLARLAGVRWFLTQKLSWNQTNPMPHHSFWWEGIDGSRVFTHFPPVDTYNATFAGAELARAVRNFAEHGRAGRSLVPFGYGDGGGGPTREMLEKARRLRDLEGSPRVAVESPAAFFEAAEAEYGEQAPVWTGEMYLELHRATYTTQAKTKQGNRRAEALLREAELWAATAALRAPGYAYPYEELDRLWRTVLLHQFHDILPGSSIAWVHREARETYAAVHAELDALTAAAAEALAGAAADAGAAGATGATGEGDAAGKGDEGGGGPPGAPGAGRGTAVLNAASFDRAEVLVGADGEPRWAEAPALGAGALRDGLPDGVAPAVLLRAGDGGFVLENGLLRVVVDADGLLSSVRDLTADREVLSPGGRGNLLQLHPDHPNQWDAWDIDRHYRRRCTDLVAAESVTGEAAGPLLASVRVVRRFGSSSAVQVLRLAAGSPRLEVATEVDWRESEKVLKAAFPLDVHADRSTAEIQFGHVHRPTHTNTGWEAARFEVCAHRWIHVGEPEYGIALLNDSTYGHDVTRSAGEHGTTTTVRLTLLRAPRCPDPETDRDVHRFRYALQPGAGIGDAVAGGHALNLPLRTVPGPAPAGPPLVAVEGPAVTVESVKLADDRSGDVVVRLYESRGGRARGTLRTGFPVAAATVTDLLERPLPDGAADAPTPAGGPPDALRLSLRPFQILTVRLTPAGRPGPTPGPASGPPSPSPGEGPAGRPGGAPA